MKIVAVVRTLNESHRIAAFLNGYGAIADRILVADGGSTDGTLDIISDYPKAEVRQYPGRLEMAGGHWRNNDSDHANFLFSWAYELAPDWIIYDDCDCRPNYLLKRNARALLEDTESDFVMAVRLYLWGLTRHFPHMAKPAAGHDRWEASLWAWRGSVDFWTVNVPPAYTFRIGDRAVADLRIDAKTLCLMPPLGLLHYSWDDEARVAEKVRLYRDSGLIRDQLHPLEFAGPLEPLPDWARE